MRIAIAFVLSAFAAAAQTTPRATLQQDAATPVFQAGAKLVEVDVVAKRGSTPAAGLKQEDFTVSDNGKKQTIAFFSVRSISAKRTSEAPLPPGTWSNRYARGPEAGGNTIVLLLDQINTPQEMQGFAIPRMLKFAASRPPQDRLGIYTLDWSGLHAPQELTGNRDQLKATADRLQARDPRQRINDTSGMSAHEATAYAAMNILGPAQAVEVAMQEVARHLAGVPGRKILVWVTTAFPLFDLSVGVDFRPEMEKAARALNDARVTLYSVDARGLIGALDGLTAITRAEQKGPPPTARGVVMSMQRGEPVNPRGLNTEQMLSDLTGGLTFFNNSNAIDESIATAVADADLTYTLGFYPDQNELDGRWHNLKVGVSRHGVSLRYRRSYFAQRATDAVSDRPTLDRLLKEPLDASQLQLTVRTAPNPARAGSLEVRVNVDLHDVQFRQENAQRKGAIDLAFYVEGVEKVMNKTIDIEIPDGQFAGFLEKGLDAVTSIDEAPAAQALRVVVQDKATGAAGSLTVPLPARAAE
jgi:VWFA-related protein